MCMCSFLIHYDLHHTKDETSHLHSHISLSHIQAFSGEKGDEQRPLMFKYETYFLQCATDSSCC